MTPTVNGLAELTGGSYLTSKSTAVLSRAVVNLFFNCYLIVEGLLEAGDRPVIDETLLRIYLNTYHKSELVDCPNNLSVLMHEYHTPLLQFYRDCQHTWINCLLEILGCIGFDNRIPHHMLVPTPIYKQFQNLDSLYDLTSTDRALLLKSIRDSLLVNTNLVDYSDDADAMTGRNGNVGYSMINSTQFIAYLELVKTNIAALYRPSTTPDRVTEAYATPIAEIIDQIKVLLLLVTNDATIKQWFARSVNIAMINKDCRSNGRYLNQFLVLDDIRNMYRTMCNCYASFSLNSDNDTHVLEQYAWLDLSHAICIFPDADIYLPSPCATRVGLTASFCFLDAARRLAQMRAEIKHYLELKQQLQPSTSEA